MNKLFSARFIMALMFTVTTCFGFLKGLISPDIFVPLVFLVVNWYFQKDRKEKKDVEKINF